MRRLVTRSPRGTGGGAERRRPGRSALARRTLHGVLTDRIGLKLAALLMAVMLWLVARAGRPTEGYVRVRLQPRLDSSLVLLHQPPPLQALVSGRAADLVKLFALPPVVPHTVSGDVPDTLLLTLSPADVRLPAELASAVRVLDVEPRAVMLRFAPRSSRQVAVTGAGRVLVRGRSGTVPDSGLRFEPATVRITGPRRVVRTLRALHPFSLVIDDTDTTAHLADLDTAGLGVEAEPPRVRVSLLGRVGRGATP